MVYVSPPVGTMVAQDPAHKVAGLAAALIVGNGTTVTMVTACTVQPAAFAPINV